MPQQPYWIKKGDTWAEYQLRLKKYVDRASKLEDDLQQIYNIVIGWCSPGMDQALATDKDFNQIQKEVDSISLLNLIKQVCYNYQPHK